MPTNSPVAAYGRPVTVRTGAVLTYLGAGYMLLYGLARLLFIASGWAAEAQSPQVGSLVGPLSKPASGGTKVALAIALLVLAVYASRGHKTARVGLTLLAAPALAWWLGWMLNDPGADSLLWVTVGPWLPLSGYDYIEAPLTIVYASLATALFWFGRGNDAYYQDPSASEPGTKMRLRGERPR